MDRVKKLGKAMNMCPIGIAIMDSSMKVKRMVREHWYPFLTTVNKIFILGSGIRVLSMESANTTMHKKIAITMGNFKITRNRAKES